MELIRLLFHYFLHLIFPAFISYIFFRKNWKKGYIIMLATMLVDLDHLLANPIFDPNRCSIGYHPLHSYPMIFLYALGSFFLKGHFKFISLGLLFHMITDFQDYYLWNLINS